MPHSDHSPSPNPSEAFTDLPPFPDNVPTAPFPRISLAKLLTHDTDEEERCWRACQELGFFYLDLQSSHGSALLEDADRLFELMKGFYELPVEEKTKYDFKSKGSYFGYKGYGEGIIDKNGTRDRNEFYNVSKDDVLGLSERLPSPEVLNSDSVRSLFKSYIDQSHAICSSIIALVDQRLPLTAKARQDGGLEALHRLSATSGDQIRFVKAPPQRPSTKGVALGEHTDFGSVTVLFNRLGGLQVRLPEGLEPARSNGDGEATEAEERLCEDGWCYVKPLPGHCMVNLGDALVKFSNGQLRSNIHRVVAPPGRQGEVTRYSLVYFCRPEDDVLLGSLVEGGEEEGDEKVTSKEWILRRALGRRDASGWEKSEGTEDGSMRRGGMRA
ncbi:putative 1-aminocyclopropane-1-carboxylate oxidase [Macroventuria anomochaeta]|uniref:1-aminocyclopropane-1-carboxylate oxidase n=1 Tax=Macroventuria anomochaeta TaxID=301207 RepID=A0ACB6RLJ3_9PLEO|nr:putative 1-aminocyclopropane-1-carboxylate oxidase [Macroventuria anomochaeta]KAF2622881.1 putative 1-aminocyclopropane-1-carboxylate oxidase [Macroventuria anomochaeta]